MEAGLLTSLQRTSSIQGLLGQQLSSSQLSFSGSVAPPPQPGPERFCPASLLENSGHRAGQRAGLGQGSGLHYESPFGKWSFSGRKGFNGPAAVEGEGGTVQTIRTQVKRLYGSLICNFNHGRVQPVEQNCAFEQKHKKVNLRNRDLLQSQCSCTSKTSINLIHIVWLVSAHSFRDHSGASVFWIVVQTKRDILEHYNGQWALITDIL